MSEGDLINAAWADHSNRLTAEEVVEVLRGAGVIVRMHGTRESYGLILKDQAWVLPSDERGDVRVGTYQLSYDHNGDADRRNVRLGDILKGAGIPITMHPAGDSWIISASSRHA